VVDAKKGEMIKDSREKWAALCEQYGVPREHRYLALYPNGCEIIGHGKTLAKALYSTEKAYPKPYKIADLLAWQNTLDVVKLYDHLRQD